MDVVHRLHGCGRGRRCRTPHFDTPEHIRVAAIKAMERGKTRYGVPAGVLEFREAICAKLQRDNGLEYAPDQISVGSGGKQTIFNALASTLLWGPVMRLLFPLLTGSAIRTLQRFSTVCRCLSTDLIVADKDGAVVVPAAFFDDVLETAIEQEALEEWIISEVEKGASLPGLYPPNEESIGR